MIKNLTEYIYKLAELKLNFGTDDFFFRGQGDESWEVDSGAYRRLKRNNLDLNSSTMFSYIKNLIIETRKRDFKNNFNDFDLIAEIQHLGGATMFIDFSKDAFIALYMACISSAKNVNPIVYCIQKDIAELMPLNTNGDYSTWFEETNEINNFYYFPSLVNNRIIKQSGLFIFNKLGFIENTSITESIKIDVNFKSNIIKELKEYANLTEEAVYPDLQGFLNANNQFSYLDLSSEDYQKALSDFENRSYYTAINSFLKCIENKFNEVACLKKIGICYSKLFNNKEAILYLERYIDKASNDPEAYYYLGLQYFRNLDESAQELSKHYVLSSITDKSYEKACQYLQKAIEINPQNPRYHITLGDLHFHEGLYREEYNHKISLGYFDRDKVLKAKECYEKANTLTIERKGKIHNQLGIISLVLTKNEDKQNYIESVKWDNSSKVTGFANLGAYYFDLYAKTKNERDLKQGIYFSHQAIFIDKFHFNAYKNVIYALMNDSNYDFAKKLLIKYLSLIPDSSSLIILLSEVIEIQEKERNPNYVSDRNRIFEKICKKILPENIFVEAVWADYLLNQKKLDSAFEKLYSSHLVNDNYLLRIIFSKYHFLRNEIEFAMANLEIASSEITKEELRYCVNVYLRKIPEISILFTENNLEEKIENWIK